MTLHWTRQIPHLKSTFPNKLPWLVSFSTRIWQEPQHSNLSSPKLHPFVVPKHQKVANPPPPFSGRGLWTGASGSSLSLANEAVRAMCSWCSSLTYYHWVLSVFFLLDQLTEPLCSVKAEEPSRSASCLGQSVTSPILVGVCFTTPGDHQNPQGCSKSELGFVHGLMEEFCFILCFCFSLSIKMKVNQANSCTSSLNSHCLDHCDSSEPPAEAAASLLRSLQVPPEPV